MKAEDIKGIVKEKYSEIARQSAAAVRPGCCGPSDCCGQLEFSMIGDEYIRVEGYNPDADLGLGCGLPTEYAGIEIGHSVLDLGCGAGNDCFIARKLVGDAGEVTGLDFSEEMLAKAEINLQKSGYSNMKFVQGDIENIPLPDAGFDVVISNCVLNLVPDKQKAFAEIFRVLKTGGHFCISDVVIIGNLPAGLKEAAEMYAGCVSGAVTKDEYLGIIEDRGFTGIEIKKEKVINIPDAVLQNYLSAGEAEAFRKSGTGIYSITVTAQK